MKSETFFNKPVFNLRMKSLFTILILALAAVGCVTKSTARKQAQQAYLQGRDSVLKEQQASQTPGVKIIGAVQNSQVPWVAGLTLAQAIATANYIDSKAPKQIIITRGGESATLGPNDLLNGTAVPLESGDVVELRP